MKKTTRWASFIVALIAFVFVGGGVLECAFKRNCKWRWC